LLTGDPIRGAEAADIGLITDAVPDEELDDVVARMANRLAEGATHAIRWTKMSINNGLKTVANSVIPLASAAEALTQLTNDHKVGLEAVIEKTKPTFTGT
jgi:enoyl-CoA hydratase